MSSTDASQPRYRSGAVARMLRMPVATLRIWERRYQVAAPATTPTGHRLYSASDVQRLALIKQLSDLGHSISALAPLDMPALEEVARTHASVIAGRPVPATGEARPWRVVVVGKLLGQRLGQATMARRLGRPCEILAQVEHLAGLARLPDPGPVDALLLQLPGLLAPDLPQLQAARERLQPRETALLYGFAPQALVQSLDQSGVHTLREPQTDTTLAIWLRQWCEPLPPVVAAPATAEAGEAVPPRRYDDATLADFAGLSSTIACECPRHVAELLMQLSRFEAYSGDCAHRSPADAALHAYLQQVAGQARALFETALERVAVHEGLMLPRG